MQWLHREILPTYKRQLTKLKINDKKDSASVIQRNLIAFYIVFFFVK